MINWSYKSFFQHLSVDLYLRYNEAINKRARVLNLKDTLLNQDQTLKTFFTPFTRMVVSFISSFIWNFLAASQSEQSPDQSCWSLSERKFRICATMKGFLILVLIEITSFTKILQWDSLSFNPQPSLKMKTLRSQCRSKTGEAEEPTVEVNMEVWIASLRDKKKDGKHKHKMSRWLGAAGGVGG